MRPSLGGAAMLWEPAIVAGAAIFYVNMRRMSNPNSKVDHYRYSLASLAWYPKHYWDCRMPSRSVGRSVCTVDCVDLWLLACIAVAARGLAAKASSDEHKPVQNCFPPVRGELQEFYRAIHTPFATNSASQPSSFI
ncbi:hypothetical protein ACLOJK_017394 [Asimina triloba]